MCAWNEREDTMGATLTDHQWSAMMHFRQKKDVTGFLLEEAHSGSNMQDGLGGARVGTGR